MAEYNLGTARGVIEMDYKGSSDVARAEADVTKLGAVSEKSGARTRRSMDGIAKGTAIAGGLIAGGLALAVKSAADFEKEISNIGAVTGANGKQMDAVKDKALQLGKDTQFSAGEAAQAINELAKAGIKLPDVLNGAADATVNLAAAGEVSMPEAATIASNAMNQFALKAADMPKVADAIAGAANASAIDVGEFGQSLQQVGAVANLAGLDFHDTSVAIAEMGNAGIKGSDAGTSLKSFLSNLIPTTQAATAKMIEMGLIAVNSGKAMKVLADEGIHPASNSFSDIIKATEKYVVSQGVANKGTVKARQEAIKLAMSTGAISNQFFDAQGNTKKLGDIQDKLADSMKGMSKEQKLANLRLLFGSDAIRAAAVLSDAGAKGYDKMGKAMGKVSAADVAKKKMDNLSGSFEQLKGSLETFAIQIGSILLPKLKSLVDHITGMVNFFLELPGPVKQAAVIFAVLASGLLLATAAFIKISKGIKAFKEAMAVMKELQLISKVGFLANPWVLGILALIAVIALVIKYHKQIWAAIKVTWDKILGALKVTWGAIKGAFNAFIGFITKHWKAFLTGLLTILLGPFGLMIGLVIQHWDKVKALFKAAWDAITGVFSAFIGFFTDHWKAFLTGLLAILLGPFGLMIGLFIQHFDLIKSVVTKVFNAIRSVVSKVLGFIVGVIRKYLNVWRAIFTKTFDAIKSVVMRVINFVRGFIQREINGIKNIIHGIMAVANFFRDAFQRGYEFVRDKVGIIVNFVKGLPGRITAAASGMWDGIKDAFRAAVNWIIDAWNGLEFHIPGFDPPGPGPKFGGFTLGVPDIPRLAKGGITTGPTLAMIGEAGTEAVLPLKQLLRLVHVFEQFIPVFKGIQQRSMVHGPSVAAVSNRNTSITSSRHISVTNNYPKPESPSESLPRTLRNLEFVGALG